MAFVSQVDLVLKESLKTIEIGTVDISVALSWQFSPVGSRGRYKYSIVIGRTFLSGYVHTVQTSHNPNTKSHASGYDPGYPEFFTNFFFKCDCSRLGRSTSFEILFLFPFTRFRAFTFLHQSVR